MTKVLVGFIFKNLLKRPDLANRAAFYIFDLRSFLATCLNELNYRLGNKKSFKLTSATVELSARCNLDCIMCARHEEMTREETNMSLEMFKAIVDLNPDIDMYTLVGWGEAMLNKHFFEMTEHLKQRKKRVALTTNATMFNNDSIVDRIIDSGIQHITVSMDGIDEVFEKYRQTSYKKIEENLMRLSKKITATKAKIFLEINSIGTPDVLAQREEMRRRFDPFVKDIRFSSYLKYNERLETNRTKPCREFWRGMITVFADGTVVPCCMDYNSTMNLGNAANMPLQKLWNSEAMQDFRNEHLQLEFKRRCSTCFEEISEHSGVSKRFD